MVDNINYVQSMSGSEIARELGISRQAVSQLLKRSISKVYNGILEKGLTDTPTETAMFMMDWFGIEDEEDIQQFYDLFSVEIQDKIRRDAKDYVITEQ